MSTKTRLLVCLVVCLAAVAVLARGFIKNAKSDADKDELLFATELPAAWADQPAAKATESSKEKDTNPTLWRAPLDSLASLDKVASQEDAVFVLLSVDDSEEIQLIKEQVEVAVNTMASNGTSIAVFELNENTPDYARISTQVPPPCVLALSKGGGISVVANDVTKAKLLQALVAASRPSGCGPSSGCAPADCD